MKRYPDERQSLLTEKDLREGRNVSVKFFGKNFPFFISIFALSVLRNFSFPHSR